MSSNTRKVGLGNFVLRSPLAPPPPLHHISAFASAYPLGPRDIFIRQTGHSSGWFSQLLIAFPSRRQVSVSQVRRTELGEYNSPLRFKLRRPWLNLWRTVGRSHFLNVVGGYSLGRYWAHWCFKHWYLFVFSALGWLVSQKNWEIFSTPSFWLGEPYLLLILRARWLLWLLMYSKLRQSMDQIVTVSASASPHPSWNLKRVTYLHCTGNLDLNILGHTEYIRRPTKSVLLIISFRLLWVCYLLAITF